MGDCIFFFARYNLTIVRDIGSGGGVIPPAFDAGASDEKADEEVGVNTTATQVICSLLGTYSTSKACIIWGRGDGGGVGRR